MGFQENLKYYREKAGYKQAKDFYKLLGVPYSTYIGYESKGREPKYNTLCKIADLLHVSTDELLGRENNILGMNEDERLKQIVNQIFTNDTTIKFLKMNKEHLYFDVYFNDEKIFMGRIKKSDFISHINELMLNQQKEKIQNLYQFVKDEILNSKIKYCEDKMEQYKNEYNLIDFKTLPKDKLIAMFPAYFNWSNVLYKIFKLKQQDNK